MKDRCVDDSENSSSHTKPSVFGVCSKLPRAIQMSQVACVPLCWDQQALGWAAGQSTAHHSSIIAFHPGFLLIESRCQVDSALEAHQHPRENVNLKWEVLLGLPESSQTHWDQCLVGFIIPSSAETCKCRKEPLTHWLESMKYEHSRGFFSSCCFCLDPKQHCPKFYFMAVLYSNNNNKNRKEAFRHYLLKYSFS